MQPIKLTGEAFDIGRIYGKVTRSALKQHLARVYSQAKRKGISKATLQLRAGKLKLILKQVAPCWLEEIRGTCAETKIDPKDILTLNSLPQNFYQPSPGQNCTSFVIIGSASKTGENILHKNRDELPFAQNFFLKEIKGCFRYSAGGTIGDLGTAHFLNEKGLAGANNSGSRIILEEINDTGLSDCHIMRLVAEKASSCEEALQIIKEVINKGFCGQAGSQRGMIFLFVDRHKGLVVENTSYHLTYRWVKRGKEVRANDFLLPEAKTWILEENPAPRSVKSSQIRYERGRELLREEPKISPSFFRKVSRDSKNYPFSICNDNKKQPTMTISAFTHIIRRKASPLLSLSWVCSGPPAHYMFFPYYIGGISSPGIWLDAQCNQSVNKIFKKRNRTNCYLSIRTQRKWEETLEKQEAKVARELSKSAMKKNVSEIRQSLDTHNMNWAETTFRKILNSATSGKNF